MEMASKTQHPGSDDTTTPSRRQTMAMFDAGSRPVSTFYPGRSSDESPSRRAGPSLGFPEPFGHIPDAARFRDFRRRSPSPSSASAVSFSRFRVRLFPKSTDPMLLLDSDDDDFLPHARPRSRAQSPDHCSVSSSTGTVLPWIRPFDALPSPPPRPPQRPSTPTYSRPRTPESASTPSFRTAPSQPLTPKTASNAQRPPHRGNQRPTAPTFPLTPTSNKRKSTAPHIDETSPSSRFRRTSPEPLYPKLPGVLTSRLPIRSRILPTTNPNPDPFLSRPLGTDPPPKPPLTLLSPPTFPSLVALWRGTPRDAEPPLPASGPDCPHCAGSSSLMRVGTRSANAGRPYYGCDRACRDGRRFVMWADLIGVGEGGNVECYCGEPARWSWTRRWVEVWNCTNGRCGFTRWGENLEGRGKGGRAYC